MAPCRFLFASSRSRSAVPSAVFAEVRAPRAEARSVFAASRTDCAAVFAFTSASASLTRAVADVTAACAVFTSALAPWTCAAVALDDYRRRVDSVPLRVDVGDRGIRRGGGGLELGDGGHEHRVKELVVGNARCSRGLLRGDQPIRTDASAAAGKPVADEMAEPRGLIFPLKAVPASHFERSLAAAATTASRTSVSDTTMPSGRKNPHTSLLRRLLLRRRSHSLGRRFKPSAACRPAGAWTPPATSGCPRRHAVWSPVADPSGRGCADIPSRASVWR